ncbi:MAG: S-methyl-5-thioribose-1-phosphate isomerase [Panacagrimonas sp.]
MSESVVPIVWTNHHLRLLDQRELPVREVWIECHSAADVAQAIHGMAVRGAPAIGIAAAYGLVLDHRAGRDYAEAEQVLAQSRPTAVNLRWALARMRIFFEGGADALALEAEAEAIHREDLEQNLRMAEIGAALLPQQDARVLTHCNTGALATGGHGTALGVIRTAWKQGRIAEVYNTETRPWLQGARLTAWELQRENIPAILLADGAAAHLMGTTRIDWVIVGADRIAANGDAANKIGTYMLAVAARRHGTKFMVVAPSGTFDLACPDGTSIPIEERGSQELTEFQGRPHAPAGVRTWNPVFDVTPAELIDALVCERGWIKPTSSTAVAGLLRGE